MTNPDDDDVLVCAFARRPPGAPTVFDVGAAVRRITRRPDSITVEFDPAAAATVAAYVAAERRCCPAITWDLEREPTPRLTIATTPGRLQTLVEMYRMAGTAT